MNLCDRLLSGRGDALALLDLETGAELSYAGLDAAAARLAAGLAAAGARPGDRIATRVAKSAGAVALHLATLRGGFVDLPVNTALAEPEAAHLVRDAEPALFVVDTEADEALCARLGLRTTTLAALDAAGAASPPLPPAAVGPETLAALIYTSGTTGRPKGAMVTHGNLIANAEAMAAAWRFGPRDRLLHALPLFHGHGLFLGLHVPFAAGAAVLMLPRFDAARVAAALPRATVFMGVPTFFARLLSEPGLDAKTAAGVRLFVSGSAPLPPAIAEAFRARAGRSILERYGTTETCIIASAPLDGPHVPGAVGMPVPRVALRLTGEDGRPVAQGTVGSVETRGPSLFAGYWRRPDATAAEMTSDGWFRTGDIGLIGEDGQLRLVGRSKDLVISGGYNVYAREVEDALDALDGVAESAVIGVPHPDFGEAVVAVVTPARAEAPPAPAALIAAARSRLAGYKTPKSVIVVEALPRNAMGKVLKAELRARYAALFAPSA